MIMTAYSTWSPQWSETEHEVFRDFGFAAFEAQMLEAALVHILLAGEHAGRIQFNKKDIESELFLSTKTLGRLICELKRGGIDDQSTDLLEDALEARNFLAHHFFNWHSEDFITPEGRGRMLKELEQLRYRIGRARIVFGQIRKHFYEHVFGISAAEAQTLYEKYLRRHRNVVEFEPS